MIAQAAHIPVHLGAMPASVLAAAEAVGSWAAGDLVVLNDPYLGGTHLPDITMVSPVFVEEAGGDGPSFVVASRAHHADVGGMSPGSMPLASEIYQEGLIIPPIKLADAGRTNREVLALILRNVRTPTERRGDLAAQMAAHRVGEQRLREIVARYGLAETLRYAHGLLAYAERLTRAAIARIPDGVYAFADELDDDGRRNRRPVAAGGQAGPRIQVRVTVEGERMTVDFSGSSPAVAGPLNAVRSIAQSAAWYVVRCVVGADAGDLASPVNSGTFAPVEVITPKGSILDAEPPHAVAGGNVETSQRIVDVVLGALAQALPDRIPAASQGTMNNVAIGGYDQERGRPFAYYETVGGGAGAGPAGDGLSGVHVHMTNTLDTPVEALEYAYPFRVRRYALRRGSGGAGRHQGGDGLVREIEFLCPATVTLLTERRRTAPYGLRGGPPGAVGRNVLIRGGGWWGEKPPAGSEPAGGSKAARPPDTCGTGDMRHQELPGKAECEVDPGDVLSLQTPGGGGWGEKP